MIDDGQLLREYAASQSEEAFQQLVSRHIALVYSTALRRLNGDSHLAQDAAQLVFTNLARKARQLPADVVLAGWLHRDTCFTTLELLRRERRRQAREEAAFAMQELEQNPSAPDWDSLRPCLDEALNQLPAKDRDTLLLRFFEQRSLHEIGERLGFGESGASRRVSRALDKLRAVLARRGIVTTSAALSALLAVQAAQGAAAMPAGLAASVAVASVSSAVSAGINSTATSGLLATMATIKTKIGITALVGLVILVPVGMKLHYASQARAHRGEALPSDGTAAEQYRELERQHVGAAAQHLLPLIMHAAENNNRLPASLEEVGLTSDQFELVYTGAMPATTNELATTIVIREKQPWRTPKGTWARAYGYADGHSQLGTSPDGDFREWESRIAP